MPQAAKQAVSYLRVSSLGQINGDGLTRQRESIAAYAKAHGIDVILEFSDEGVSGTTELAQRTGLASLLHRVVSNGVRTILVERADRLARDLMVSEMILNQFRQAGVRVVEAESGTDLTVGEDDPTRRLIRQVLGAVAEHDKNAMVLRLRAARERKRRNEGRCEGRKPFGDHPGERETIDRMRQLNRKRRFGIRRGPTEIARILNEEGQPTRMGGAWSPGVVARLLNRMGAPRN